MDGLLTAADVEVLAQAGGLSMAEVCRRAQIAQSTFSRWKRGKTEPTLDIYRRLVRAVEPGVRASTAIDKTQPIDPSGFEA